MSAAPVTHPVPDEGPNSAADAFATGLGVRLLSWGPGEATAELVVEPRHLNALGVAHGGAVFGLADAALARASNDPGEPAVVFATHMQFLRASRPGDRLVAVAWAQYRGGRVGAYRVEIHRDEELVAAASGESVRLSGAATRDRRSS